MSNLFIKSTQGHSALAAPYETIKQTLQNNASVSANAAAAMVTLESRNSLGAEMATLESLQQNVQTMFSEIHDKLSAFHKHDSNGKVDAKVHATLESRAMLGFAGMMMASDASMSALANQTLQAPPATAYGAKSITLNDQAGGAHDRRAIYTPEAFKNYDLQSSRIFSALFNYSVVDFDDFTRTFWRPVTISPDSSYVELLVNVLTVFNGKERQLNAKAGGWNRHNLVRAVADHTILNTDLTKAIPSVNTENTEFFSTKIAPVTIMQAERPVTTAPIVSPVQDLDYIALCMPEWLIKTGDLDQRDNLDPAVSIKNLYVSLAADILKFEVTGEPMSEFNGAVQGDRQLASLSWTTGSFFVNKDTVNMDQSPLVDLASVVTGELTLAIRLNIQAEINLETGELTFSNTPPTVRWLKDKEGNPIAATDARYTTIATALKGVTEVAFDLNAFRSNADRRQRGQLINIRQFAENVVVPWRDPIAAERPADTSSEQDTSDLTALMTATRIRITNEGVTALFTAEDVIKRTPVGEMFDSFTTPASLGIGRHYVLPYYHHEELDMLKIVDSLTSKDREKDIQAAIVNTLRNRLAHAYTESQYKAASDALSGGTAPKPKVAVVTDPVTARYIIEPGELRTMVDFELIVVPILDFRMKGKMKMVFITDDGGNDVNYLNFGYTFWSPEHVLVANMSRTGAYNRETQVQPRYRHYVACPIMISIDVINIEQALAKQSIDFNEVP